MCRARQRTALLQHSLAPMHFLLPLAAGFLPQGLAASAAPTSASANAAASSSRADSRIYALVGARALRQAVRACRAQTAEGLQGKAVGGGSGWQQHGGGVCHHMGLKEAAAAVGRGAPYRHLRFT